MSQKWTGERPSSDVQRASFLNTKKRPRLSLLSPSRVQRYCNMRHGTNNGTKSFKSKTRATTLHSIYIFLFRNVTLVTFPLPSGLPLDKILVILIIHRIQKSWQMPMVTGLLHQKRNGINANISLSLSVFSRGYHSQPDPVRIQTRWWSCTERQHSTSQRAKTSLTRQVIGTDPYGQV